MKVAVATVLSILGSVSADVRSRKLSKAKSAEMGGKGMAMMYKGGEMSEMSKGKGGEMGEMSKGVSEDKIWVGTIPVTCARHGLTNVTFVLCFSERKGRRGRQRKRRRNGQRKRRHHDDDDGKFHCKIEIAMCGSI